MLEPRHQGKPFGPGTELPSVPEVCLAGTTALAKSLLVATTAGLSPCHQSPLSDG